MPDRLEARGLRVVYRDARGADKIALDVPVLDFAAGAATAIMGPSGCGKTTLLYALSGLARCAGNVTWRGEDVLRLAQARRDAWRRATAGFVFQDFQLIAELSPLENVLLPARFDHFTLPRALRQRGMDLLAQFGVPHERTSVRSLSRGEAQRVALARALLRDPPIILADEPTASLDAASAEVIIAALTQLASRDGKLMVIVTHDAALAGRCNTIIRLDHGRLASGPAARESAA